MKDSNFFKCKKINEGTTLIIGPGKVYCYLLEGENKALLIDTLCGIGNIAEYCRELTDLPVIVANTHGHFDHVAGNFVFEEVYIHPEDVDMMYKMCTVEAREDYVRNQQAKFNEPMEWNASDVAETKPIRCIPIKDGFKFDLGGRNVEVIETPGHTRGSVCFLDKEHRQLFAGDSCNTNTIIFAIPGITAATSVEEYLSSLQKLKKHLDSFDTYYVSHGINPIDKSCINDAIECCEQIMAGTDDAEPGIFLGQYPCLYAKKISRTKEGFTNRLDGRIGNIAYSKDNIFMKRI